eukprot:gene9172-14223_t
MAARASAQQVAKSIAALLLALCAVPAAAEDECAVAANWEVCAGSGQLCRDDDVLNSDNWRCECPRYLGFADNSVPARGVMVASSGCVRDGECVTAGTACFTANQGCLDFDGVGGNLFQCVCIPPYHCAPGIGAAADEMLLDECSSVCSTCADRGDGSGNACHTSGQLCIDPDETVPSDWECACLHPATGNATAAAAACQYPAGSECVNSTCAAAGQACRDFSLDAVKDDWRCSCVAPYSGDPAVAAPAACGINECTARCPTCAYQGVGDGGNVCLRLGQTCADPNFLVLNDWTCLCPPSTDTVVARTRDAAECAFTGECKSMYFMCGYGQYCRDPSLATVSTTWSCVCSFPFFGAAVVGGPAECFLNECAADCPTCANSVCSGNGEACVEGETNISKAASYNDWSCVCSDAVNGTSLGSPCSLDADENCVETCHVASQGCTSNDTTCTCVAPWTGDDGTPSSPLGACFLDECSLYSAVCIAGSQKCVDDDQRTLGTWRCECQCEGCVAVQWDPGATECVLDECYAVCSTCARRADGGNHTCFAAGQRCHDPNTSHHMTSDWTCLCAADAALSGAPVLAAEAACEFEQANECAEQHAAVCRPAGQACADAAGPRLHDWACRCLEPGATQIGGNVSVAQCLLDECEATCPTCAGAKCAGRGQLCVDPDPTERSLSDWYCACDAAEGKAGVRVAGTATCVQLDDCAVSFSACADAGQLCVDPNPAGPGDWVCACPNDEAISAQQAAVPSCPHSVAGDECAGTSVCDHPGQYCVDPDPGVAGDFLCRCAPPYNGTAGVAEAATCYFDECAITCATCENGLCAAAGQGCVDPAPFGNSTSDWTCVCRSDPTAAAKAGLASCGFLDECAASCEDPNPSNDSLLDYVCRCPRPYWASSVGARVGDCTVAPTAAPRPVGDQRVFFKFRTALTKQEYSAAKLIAALARVVTLRPNGTEDVAVTQCSGCKRCEVYHIATRCLKWLATDPDGCAQLAEYETAIEANLTSTKIVSGSLAELSARLGLWMQGPATATAEGVFEFLGDSLPAKYAWAAALNDNANQAQAAADADVKLILGTVEVFPAAQTPSPPDDSDDSPSFEWWIWVAIGAVALALLVTLICCCWRQTTARRRLDATVGQKRNQASPSRAAAVTDRQAKRNGTDFMMLHEMQQLPSSATTAGNPDLVNRSPSGQSLSYGMVAAETSYTSSVDLKHPHQNPIVAVFPLSEKTMELSPPKTRNSSVFAFGQSLEGQLGLGAADDLTLVYAPIEVPDLKDLGIHLMTCGSFHSIVITTGAAVLVFGEGSDGQLGFGGRRALQTPTLVPFFEGKLPRIVVGGELHTVISCDDGLYAFGCNLDGQLGLGTTPHSLSPERVSPELFTAGAELLSCGTHHTCIVFNERLYVMGWNQHGQLGLGDTVNRIVPTECSFFNSKSILDIACGVHHTVVCCDDGLYVMGGNTFGQLGLGHDLSEMTPQVLPFFNDKVVHGISAWFHTLVSTDDGVFAFGEGAHHKLGTDPDHLDPQNVHYPRPVEAFAESDVLSVHAGCEHSAVVTSDGIFTWGNGEGGKLGHASGRPVSDPAKGRLYSLNGHKAHLLSLGVDHTLMQQRFTKSSVTENPKIVLSICRSSALFEQQARESAPV